MEFNQRIASHMLEGIKKAQYGDLGLDALEELIRNNLDALDSTFPKNLRNSLDGLVPKIHNQRNINYAATMNTPDEGTELEGEAVVGIFEDIVSELESFVS